MTKNEIEVLVQNGENEYIEFKTNAIPSNLLSRHISAFANASGGTIYFGIDERNGIVGCDKDRLKKSFDVALTKITGDIVANLKFEYIDNKVIGILNIEKSKTLVSSAEGVFIRTGEMSRVMMPDEIQNILSNDTSEIQLKILTEMVSNQTNTIEGLNNIVEELHNTIAASNKFSNKLKDYIAGGIIGAIISIGIGAMLVL